MTTPVILVDGNVPRPNGTEANSTFALDTASVALTLQSTSQIGSVTWALSSAPPDSTAAIASASPIAPFSTTLGPLDVAGTYLVSVTTDAGETDEIAIAVLTANAELRIPAEAETTQWDQSHWWYKAYRATVEKVDEQVDDFVVRGTATTNSGVATELANYTVPTDSTALFDISLVGRRTSDGEVRAIRVQVVAKNVADTVTVSGLQIDTDGGDFAPSLFATTTGVAGTFSTSVAGAVVSFNVTGSLFETTNWKCVVRGTVVS